MKSSALSTRVAGLAQLQAQVIRGLACVVRGAVADEFRVAELLDGRNELLDLARFNRGGRRCRCPDEKCERKNRQGHAPAQDCMYPLSSGVVSERSR